MTQQERLYTYAEFERFARQPEQLDRRFGLLDREIYEVSPTRSHSKIVAKLLGNLFKFHEVYGVGELFPEKKQIEVHRPDIAVVVLNIGDTLDSGDVLPGFSLAVNEVFRDV